MMADPDLLTILRGLRLLREVNHEAFAHHARRLAMLLQGPTEGGHAPPEAGDVVEVGDVVENPRGPRAVGARIVKRAAEVARR